MFALVKCLVLLSVAIAVSSFSLADDEVGFHLFTSSNPTQSQVVTLENILESNYNYVDRTVFTIHTHGDTFASFNSFVVSPHITTEYVNVIAVDWRIGSSTYTEGLAQARRCGELVANFINGLHELTGVPFYTFKIIGAGLGGHVAGIAARNVGGQIPHVIALDPSLHGWSHNADRLNPNDAAVVEVIHSSAGFIGYDLPLGDIDFYPNGGTYQSGCASDVSCSHIYSYAFYRESVLVSNTEERKFVGTACESYEEAIRMGCSGERDAVFGGLEVKTDAHGIYTFSTNFSPPFAQG